MTNGDALVELLRLLKLQHYRFTTVTPATHARVLEREPPPRPDLRDIFGWNRPFRAGDLHEPLLDLLQRADALETLDDGQVKSRVRVASLDGDLFLHSAFPTSEGDSVFFGPDTYRFVRFLDRQLSRLGELRQVADMGAGTGAGGIAVARRRPDAEVTLVDVNGRALDFARANAEAAGVAVNLVESDRIPKDADLVIANPPYMIDPLGRSYRDGGDLLGGAVALDWVRQFLSSAAAGATMLLYTGAAYAGGASPLIESLAEESRDAGAPFEVEEIDPDVFGEELAEPAYAGVERISAIGIVIGSGRAAPPVLNTGEKRENR